MYLKFKGLSRHKKYLRLLRRIIAKKPLVLIRIIHNYLRIFLFREKVVRKVEIGVTFKCQCACPKCSSAFMGDPQKKELSIEEMKNVAKDILSLGAVHINLTGGEPLMADDIFEVIDAIQPHKVVITINTNGILLTEEMIDRLDKAGVDILKVSIDSPIEEEHDKSRGYPGCFKQAFKALAYIKEKKRLLGQISTVCIKENLNSDKIWKLVDMAKEYDALLGLTIPGLSGKWRNHKDVLIGPKEREVLKKLVEVPHVIRDTDEAYVSSRCPVGYEIFYLTRYGDVIPCPLIQIAFGNIRQMSVKEIWEKMSGFKDFKDELRPGCLAGEQKEFIDNYLSPLRDRPNLPIHIDEHPFIRKDHNDS